MLIHAGGDHRGRRLSSPALVAACLLIGSFAVAIDTSPALAAPERPTHDALVRMALGPHLDAAEVERLLAQPEVVRALDELLEGWDGDADRLEVSWRGKRLLISALIRERRCSLTVESGPELAPPTPRCEELTRPDGERSLDLDPRLWAKRPERPRRPPPSPAAPEAPETPEWGEAPVAPPTVLRKLTHERDPFGDAVVNAARVAHERLREQAGRRGYLDPLLPKTGDAPAVTAGPALAPMLLEPPEKAAAALANLRDPFGEGRMGTRTDLPVAGPRFGNDGPPILPELDEDCEVSWRLRERSENPPELACYRAFAWHSRLDDDEVFATLRTLTMFFDIPLARTVMALIAEDVKTSRAHEVVWAMVWLEWVGRAPDDDARIARALHGLSVGERRYLRKHLAALWSRPGFMTVRSDLASSGPAETPAGALVARLYERHLLALYPEAKDLDGLPLRAFVTDTWLWANNWLAVLDGRPEDAIEKAYHRLGEDERKVIDAFIGEPLIARRYARVPQVLARL